MKNDAFLSPFSAPMRISSRFGQPDKHHLNATALQVKETTFPVRCGRGVACGSVRYWLLKRVLTPSTGWCENEWKLFRDRFLFVCMFVVDFIESDEM